MKQTEKNYKKKRKKPTTRLNGTTPNPRGLIEGLTCNGCDGKGVSLNWLVAFFKVNPPPPSQTILHLSADQVQLIYWVKDFEYTRFLSHWPDTPHKVSLKWLLIKDINSGYIRGPSAYYIRICMCYIYTYIQICRCEYKCMLHGEV